jgi:hypothetical protein
VPCVLGAEPEPVVPVGLGEGVGLAVGDGEGEGDGDGDGEAVGLGLGDVVGAVAVKLVVVVLVLPAASAARAVTVWEPVLKPARGTLQLVVPDADCQPPPSTCSATPASDLLSEAVPATVSEVPVMLPLDGDVIATVGAVVSTLLLRRGLGAAEVGAAASNASGRATPAAVRARRGARTRDCSTGAWHTLRSRGHRG